MWCVFYYEKHTHTYMPTHNTVRMIPKKLLAHLCLKTPPAEANNGKTLAHEKGAVTFELQGIYYLKLGCFAPCPVG